jgi:hypothetical protein
MLTDKLTMMVWDVMKNTENILRLVLTSLLNFAFVPRVGLIAPYPRGGCVYLGDAYS